jgi:hypothetical protein
MKIQVVIGSALMALTALSTQGQTTAGGAAGAAAPVVVPRPSVSPAVQPAVPAIQNQTTLPAPVAPGRSQVPLGEQVPMREVLSDQKTAQAVVQDRAVTGADQALLGRLRQTMQARFQGNSAWAPINFDIANGVVTLVGTIQSTPLKQQIESFVQQTPGVLSVIDQLATVPSQVVGGTPGAGAAFGPDRALLSRVREVVLPQIQVGGQPVPVRFNVQEGVVTLTGTVPNVAQRDQIANLVQQVPGVTQVNNQMLVGTATTGIVTTAPSASPAATAPNQTGTATTSGSVITPNTLTPTGRTNQAQP